MNILFLDLHSYLNLKFKSYRNFTKQKIKKAKIQIK
jgi:hypothetical protein